MKLNKRKKLHNFPGVIVEKFLNKNFCNKIIVELNRFNNFDDFVMSGRNRINKGSNNFQKFLENSKFAKNLFKKFNKKKHFKILKSPYLKLMTLISIIMLKIIVFQKLITVFKRV